MASGIQSSLQGEQVVTSLQLHSLEALVHLESTRAAQVWSPISTSVVTSAH